MAQGLSGDPFFRRKNRSDGGRLRHLLILHMAKFKEQRVGMLVDIQNLYYTARVLYGKKVNFGNVLRVGAGDRKLIRAIAYGISTVEGMEEKFFEALEKSGFEVKTKDLQIFAGGAKKGDWDVGIAIDAVKMSRNLDVIILVSGDGDYIPLVEYIQNTTGCRVEVMAFKESCSSKLIEKADDFTNLSEDKKKFLI
jgi:uncharacterized LabA/DUF88 family protein